jgi:hypothetical protein
MTNAFGVGRRDQDSIERINCEKKIVVEGSIKSSETVEDDGSNEKLAE